MRLVAALAIILVSSPCRAGLDDPGGKPVTVGSEIKRGVDAVTNIDLGTRRAFILDYLGAYHDLLSRNRQANKDTDGFLLGAKFRHWQELGIHLGIEDSVNPFSAFVLAMNEADGAIDDVGTLQKQLGLTDEEVGKAIGYRDPQRFSAAIKEWESKTTKAQIVHAARREPPKMVPPPETKTPRTVHEAQRMAVAKYPALAQIGSPLHMLFLQMVKEEQKIIPFFDYDTEWPLRIADKAARSLAEQWAAAEHHR